MPLCNGVKDEGFAALGKCPNIEVIVLNSCRTIQLNKPVLYLFFSYS